MLIFASYALQMFSRRSKVIKLMGLLASHCTELEEESQSSVSEVSNRTHARTHAHVMICNLCFRKIYKELDVLLSGSCNIDSLHEMAVKT